MTTQTKAPEEFLDSLPSPLDYDTAYQAAKTARANYLGLLLNQKIEEKEKSNPDEKLIKAIEEERDKCVKETKTMPDTVEGLVDMLYKYSKLVKEFKGIRA